MVIQCRLLMQKMLSSYRPRTPLINPYGAWFVSCDLRRFKAVGKGGGARLTRYFAWDVSNCLTTLP
ncbi:hypothetical protein EVC02_052 [Rhizobium phage RHph_N17]|nr:hypothetical protein EVC02_052 [Rhizobium phage RHph_N17]